MARADAKAGPRDENGGAGERNAGMLMLAVGPILLFVVAVCYGVTERHSSTDTWIALASGRQILTTGEVPRVDTFSYTFAGKPWFNQNWLSHVLFYWLYDRISPSAVILGTWGMSAAMFALVLLAIRLRSGSWLGAWIGASFVAVGGYAYLSARPATVGFLLLAALMAILSALAAPGPKKRWWPAILLLPLFGIWGCAHGSFFFGYGLVGVFIGCWFVTWIFKRRAAPATVRQIAVTAVATALAAVLTVIFGPYGFENFTHPFKVAESEVFRDVSEWHPPYVPATYPPATMFWASLGVASGVLAVASALRLTAGPQPHERGRPARGAPRIGLFDVAATLLGLYMAFWARRFAPLFYILAAPTIVTAVVLLTVHGSQTLRRRGRLSLLVLSWLGMFVVAIVGGRRLHKHYLEPYRQRPELGLLERATVYEKVPQPAIEFLQRNGLQARLMTEWTLAGPVMFYAPQVKLFIDGRSQQVYDEVHYQRYEYLTRGTGDPLYPERARQILSQFDTDTVLLSHPRRTLALMKVLAESDEWTTFLTRDFWVLFLRPSSPVFQQLLELERAGRAWWPQYAEAKIARAKLWSLARPPDYDRALELYQAAVAQQATLGRACYLEMARLWIRLDRRAEARAYFQQQAYRHRLPAQGPDERLRQQLLEQIKQCWQMLGEAGACAPRHEEGAET